MSSKPQKDMDVESASLSSLSVTDKFRQRWYVIFSALGVVAGLLGFAIHFGLAYVPGFDPTNQWPAVWGAIFSAYFAAFLTFYLWNGKFYSRNAGARITKLVLWGFLAASGFIIFICNMIVGGMSGDISKGAIAGGIWALLWCGWALGLFIGFLRTPTKRRPHRPKNTKAIKIVYGIIRVLAYLLLAVATFLIALMLGHVSSLAAETVALPVPGKLVAVDAGLPAGASMNMHILCKGPTDSTFPTIILASGGGTCSASMMPLQDAMPNYRTCVFDSPGYCWSDTGKVPYVRSDQTDLVAQMLERSGEKGPFVLMGHSDGGQLSRAIFVRHPELVAAIVLLDSVNTQWYTVTYNLTGQNFLATPDNTGLVSTVDTVRAFAAVGVQRLFQRPNDFAPKYQLAVGWTWWQTRNWNSQYWGVKGGNGDLAQNWDYNVNGSYGDLPLLVLSASGRPPGAPCSSYGLPDGSDCNKAREVNDAIYRDVVVGQRDLSTRGGLVLCMNDNQPCGHGFVFTNIDWVVEQFNAYFSNVTFA